MSSLFVLRQRKVVERWGHDVILSWKTVAPEKLVVDARLDDMKSLKTRLYMDHQCISVRFQLMTQLFLLILQINKVWQIIWSTCKSKKNQHGKIETITYAKFCQLQKQVDTVNLFFFLLKLHASVQEFNRRVPDL
jgi:hypothetical protein